MTFGGDDPRVVWTVANITEPIGTLFLRLLLMIVVPLVFSSLVVGVAGIGDVRKLGRVGLKSFGYCLLISACSVIIGIGLTNIIRPGERVAPETRAGLEARYGNDAAKRVADATKKPASTDSGPMAVVKTLIPSNPVASIAGIRAGEEKQTDTPDMLHLMLFAVLLGVAATLVKPEVTAPFLSALAGALRDLLQDHRHHHEGRALRGRLSALQ